MLPSFSSSECLWKHWKQWKQAGAAAVRGDWSWLALLRVAAAQPSAFACSWALSTQLVAERQHRVLECQALEAPFTRPSCYVTYALHIFKKEFKALFGNTGTSKPMTKT